jgi:hypothetical protein
MTNSKDIEKRIRGIEARNRRVELDKAWETSWTRKVSVAVLTYIVVSLYLAFVVKIDPWINAIVPTMGFLLSTLTLNYVKAYWVKKREVGNR